MKKSYSVLKRLLDILIAFFGIIVASPLILIVSIINLFASKGHPYYLDKRVGYKGKDIKVIKFTSMKNDANTNEEYFSDEQKELWESERKVENDPRITKFGFILRKTSIDEIPQLFNILIGDLSFVGPRPVTRHETIIHYTEEEREKLFSVKPGLTGNWAVHGRSSVEYKTHKRQELELEYVDKVSFLTDLKIVLRTFKALFTFKEVK